MLNKWSYVIVLFTLVFILTQRAFVKRFIEISCQNELQKWHSTKNGCAFFVSKIPCPGSLCTRGLTGMVLGWQVDAAAVSCLLELRPVVPGGAGGAMAPPDFGRWVNPISTKWGRLCPPNNTSTLGFSDLPTALQNRGRSHKVAILG